MNFPSFPGFSGRLFAAARRQGPRARGRAGLQRLAHRRVVRHLPGPVHPDGAPGAVGPRARAPPRSAASPPRAATRSRSPRTPPRSGYPSFHDAHWDPLWTALVGRGHGRVDPPRLVGQARRHRARRADRRDDHAPAHEHLPGRRRPAVVARASRSSRTCSSRSSEGGTGWIPYFLDRIDRTYDMHHLWTGQDFGDQLPSEVFREHFLTCFIADPVGVKLRDTIGIDNICVGVRLPALRLVVAERARGARGGRCERDVPDDELDKITHENAMRWFRFDPFAHRAKRGRARSGRCGPRPPATTCRSVRWTTALRAPRRRQHQHPATDGLTRWPGRRSGPSTHRRARRSAPGPAAHARPRVPAVRPPHRPRRHAPSDLGVRPRDHAAIAIDEWMGGQPRLLEADAAGARLRGRLGRDDLQEHPARHRRAAPVHGLPVRHRRPRPRRVLARPLRRADGRRADGRRVRPRDVPRHRGPDLRRHRHRGQRPGPGAARSTARRGSLPTAAALPLDGDHRRVPSRAPRPRQAKDMWETTLAQARPRRHRPGGRGRSHYSDPMLDDLRFEDFSRSALVRIAQEVCIQWHLLSQAFRRSTRKFTESEQLVTDIFRRQFTGIAGTDRRAAEGGAGTGRRPRRRRPGPGAAPGVPAPVLHRPRPRSVRRAADHPPRSGRGPDRRWRLGHDLVGRPPRTARRDRAGCEPLVPLRRGRR